MRLTALVVPELRLVSVPARADYWSEVRRTWSRRAVQAMGWPGMTFEQIAKKVRGLRGEHDDDALDDVLSWAAAVRGATPLLAGALDAEVERLVGEVGVDGFATAAAGHRAGAHLTRLRAGKLSRDHLGCTSPEQVLGLAAALGVTLGVPSAP
jgi:hypothetical protein